MAISAQHGVVVGGGLAHLRGRILRVSNLGYVVDEDLLAGIEAIETVLSDMGGDIEVGAGVTGARDVLKK